MRAAHFDRLSVNGGTNLFTAPLRRDHSYDQKLKGVEKYTIIPNIYSVKFIPCRLFHPFNQPFCPEVTVKTADTVFC